MAEIDSPLTIPHILQETVSRFNNRDAMAFVGETPVSYGVLNERIQSVIAFLENNGITPGDKVAILSTNMPNWGITYFAIVSMGAVAVPILPDFTPTEITNVINHSGARAIFMSASLIQKLNEADVPALDLKVLIDDFTLPAYSSARAWSESARPSGKYSVSETDLASIIYTSGTTGRSKGVMLSHLNITFNAIRGGRIHHMD